MAFFFTFSLPHQADPALERAYADLAYQGRDLRPVPVGMRDIHASLREVAGKADAVVVRGRLSLGHRRNGRVRRAPSAGDEGWIAVAA